MAHVDKRATAPRSEGRLLIVLELEIERTSTPRWVRMTESLPSRAGAYTKVWPVVGGLMDDRNVEDMCSFVCKALTDAVLTGVGIQMSL